MVPRNYEAVEVEFINVPIRKAVISVLGWPGREVQRSRVKRSLPLTFSDD